jgi:hypothetical protein
MPESRGKHETQPPNGCVFICGVKASAFGFQASAFHYNGIQTSVFHFKKNEILKD